MRKILALLLIAGLLVSACCIQVAAESTDDVDADFIGDEYFGGPPGGSVPCGGGEGNGSGGVPG
jgi:hypothetical protein